MLTFDTQELEGKPFALGSQDCFSVVRDFYKKFFDVDMPNIARPNDWDAAKDDLINKHFEQCGFQKLDVDENWPPRPADLLVTTLGSSVPNHLVIYLGNNEILHHKSFAMSSRETMRPAWKRYTSYMLRHPEVPNLQPKKPILTLTEAYHEGFV